MFCIGQSQGYNFHVRAAPLSVETAEGDEEGEEAGNPSPTGVEAAVATIRGAAQGLKFIAPQGAPILSFPEGASSEADDKGDASERPKSDSRLL